MPKTICIVDDEDDIIQLVRALLEHKNFEVHTARNGLLGMELIQEVKPDLAILDLMMPGMSGLEMCKRLRASEEFRDLPILVLSAIARDSDKPEEYWAAGLQSDDFIRKPFDPANLQARVEYLLRRAEYKSTVPRPGAAGGSQGANGGGEKISHEDLSPEDVVRQFIQSWNGADFGLEFDCLGKEMQYNLSRQEYVSRRMSTYNENGRDQEEHICYAFLQKQIDENAASIICERQVKRGISTKRTRESYKLSKTAEGWKIVQVRSA
ncbi:response regulator [Candidatus Sumerlaeota bacterium]|nr:response regulator [Candidatus Sumerlaeota bacterium]